MRCAEGQSVLEWPVEASWHLIYDLSCRCIGLYIYMGLYRISAYMAQYAIFAAPYIYTTEMPYETRGGGIPVHKRAQTTHHTHRLAPNSSRTARALRFIVQTGLKADFAQVVHKTPGRFLLVEFEFELSLRPVNFNNGCWFLIAHTFTRSRLHGFESVDKRPIFGLALG